MAIIWTSQSLLIDLHTGVVGFLQLLNRRDLGVLSLVVRLQTEGLLVPHWQVGGRWTVDR